MNDDIKKVLQPHEANEPRLKEKLTRDNSEKIRSRLVNTLSYLGFILTVFLAVVYLFMVVYLVVGVSVKGRNATSVWAYMIINAMMTTLIGLSMTMQGAIWAKNENKEILTKYYNTKTKDKKNHNMTFFWLREIWQTVGIKTGMLFGTSVLLIQFAFNGLGEPMYIVIAVANIIGSIGMGLLGLNKSYNYVYNSFIPYVKERIDESDVGTSL